MIRMRKLFIAAVVAGSLGGCNLVTPTNTADFTACSAALLASGSMDPAALAVIAITSPGCQALAGDVLQELIDLIATKNAARRGLVRP